MRGLRARTSCVTSCMVLAFAFGNMVVNHFARRSLPERAAKMTLIGFEILVKE